MPGVRRASAPPASAVRDAHRPAGTRSTQCSGARRRRTEIRYAPGAASSFCRIGPHDASTRCPESGSSIPRLDVGGIQPPAVVEKNTVSAVHADSRRALDSERARYRRRSSQTGASCATACVHPGAASMSRARRRTRLQGSDHLGTTLPGCPSRHPHCSRLAAGGAARRRSRSRSARLGTAARPLRPQRDQCRASGPGSSNQATRSLISSHSRVTSSIDLPW